MKAVLQNFKTGEMSITEVPPPRLQPGGVVVQNVASLISGGTEKAAVELAKMNPLQKARARPDLVKKVLAKAGQEGLLGTVRIVGNLVSAPLPLGYSCAGVVRQAGGKVTDIAPGQRVACAGLGYANHAEMVYVPRNLVVPIPEQVTYEQASYVTVGAIALHCVRQASPSFGESVAVIGLGLVGQIIAQICSAAGCRVFGIDTDPAKVSLARSNGADAGAIADDANLQAEVMAFTRSKGADAVIVAAGTKSSEPLATAAEIARDRARVVAVGDVGHKVPRREYYEKELVLMQSRSYGPGRYDPLYEEHGVDYPIGYVRWTENRNMQSFLDLVAAGKINLDALTTHRFPIEQAMDGYALLLGKKREPYIGIVLQYDKDRPQPAKVAMAPPAPPKGDAQIAVSVIGAGQFAQGLLLPALKKVPGVRIKGVATGSGLTARNVAQRYRAETISSDYKDLLAEQDLHGLIVATRHDTHAEIVTTVLNSGRSCFVEKPLALNKDELRGVVKASLENPGFVLTGFNRRFSGLSQALRREMEGKTLVMNYRVNAGPIPAEHWHQDSEVGGGRIIGEVCHFVDLMQYLCGADPVAALATSLGRDVAKPADPDNLIAQLQFADGSIGVITYTSVGDPGFSKERLEVFGGGMAGVIDNWRSLGISGQGRKINKKCRLQSDKGFEQEMAAYVDGIKTGLSPISLQSQVATTLATFAIRESLRTGAAAQVGDLETLLAEDA
ncbi:bi-domain-containing oxidoreductase [Desulfoferula mesophila]|uniref:Oxidoreductase n=1 Tax=Desulfoferula mesophila TaxID=3058419 RepID=A0AAU9F1T5_9BACT|nr:oxidoreductase [Desulfoferula mesophilus]